MGRGHISRPRRNLGSGEALPSHGQGGSPPCRAPTCFTGGALGSILHHPERWDPNTEPHLGLGYPMGQLGGLLMLNPPRSSRAPTRS